MSMSSTHNFHSDTSLEMDSSKMSSPNIMSARPSTSTSAFTSTTSSVKDLKDLNQLLLTSNKLSTIDKSHLHSHESESGEVLKLVIVCVGLPARGKSYITKKLTRYLNWMQFNTKIFNVGNTRRQEKGKPSDVPIQGPTLDEASTSHDASFFDPENTENFHRREQWARETLDSLLNYLLYEDGNVGIFDATNTTKARRRWIVETINNKTNGLIKILFLESVCTDNKLIEKNIRLKLSGPDYKKMDRNLALKDFKNRLSNYELVYETIDDAEEIENEKYDIQYVKIINAGKKVVSYNISGFLSSQCVFFLLNFNLTDRQIWLTTNGESEFNKLNKKGGDAPLSKDGLKFAKALPKFIARKRDEFKFRKLNQNFINDESSFHSNDKPLKFEKNFNIWTSNLRRSIETAEYFTNNNNENDDKFIFESFRMLNDLSCGSLDSIKEDEFRYEHPQDYENQMKNKLSYRFPGLGGESYLDVIARLRPIIIELERLKTHVLIISHRVIIRVLLCYFMNLDKEMMTELDVQHDYVYCIEPKPYGLDLKIWQYSVEVDDFFEVDEIAIMQKKRKRASISINSSFKPVITNRDLTPTPNQSSSNLSTTDHNNTKYWNGSNNTTDSDTSDDEDWNDIKSFRNKYCVSRSDSQCYEFSNGDNESATVVSGNGAGNTCSSCGHSGYNSPVNESVHNKRTVVFQTPVINGVVVAESGKSLDDRVKDVLGDVELVEQLKKLLIR